MNKSAVVCGELELVNLQTPIINSRQESLREQPALWYATMDKLVVVCAEHVNLPTPINSHKRLAVHH